MTLVSLSLPVAQVVRYPFKNSKMKRDVLIVDIEVAREGYGVGGGVYRRNDLCEDEVLRIANVHLESTADGIRERPWQMHLVAKLLQQPQVLAGVLAGDVNALLREDEVLPGRNGLGDAFDFTGGKYGGGYGSFGEEETGATWGVGKRGRLGTVRRDKVLYTGNVSFTGGGVVGGKVLKRIGMGLRCETRGRGYNASVSDHCGLATHICIGGLRSLKGRVRRVMDDRLITYRGGRGEW